MADPVQSGMESTREWANRARPWAVQAVSEASPEAIIMGLEGETPHWTVIAGALGATRPAAAMGDPGEEGGSGTSPRSLG